MEARRAERAGVQDGDVVLAAALRFLELRARSVDEVRRRLARAGYPQHLVEAAVARLLELGMLDDDAFARAWVESRDRAHPRGERALRAELRAKAIDDAIIDRVLDERRAGLGGGPQSAEADGAAAGRLLERRQRTLLRLADPRRRRERAWALLARAGFDSETARAAVLAAERGWATGPPDDDSEP